MSLDLENLFNYHPPVYDQHIRYGKIRAAARAFAEVIADLTPESAEQTLALRAVSLATMHANSAIALNEKDQDT